MAEIRVRSDFDVELVQSVGNDQMICQAARVSTLGADSLGTDESAGLIRFLMKNRHGSPFEHGSMTFRISAPIFVWREFMRHRIGFSYNEESGRYKVLDGVFYLPDEYRPTIQVGKTGAYDFIYGDWELWKATQNQLIAAYKSAWLSYTDILESGVAGEVSRMCLPVAIYSTAYVTCNPRSLMSFLSLRTKDENSTFPSYPLWEINQVAVQMEELFTELYPITWATFDENGRVSP